MIIATGAHWTAASALPAALAEDQRCGLAFYGYLFTYTTEPGSPSHDALSLLASWATSPAHDSQASPHDNDEQSTRQDRGDDTPSGSASRPRQA